MKSEEIEESVSIQEGHKVDSISELQQEQPKKQKAKLKASEQKDQSVEMESSSQLESTSTIDSVKKDQKKIKPRMLADHVSSVEIRDSGNIESALSLSDDSLKESESVMPSLTEDEKSAAGISSEDKFENFEHIESDLPELEFV